MTSFQISMFAYTIQFQGTKKIYISISGGRRGGGGCFDKIIYSFMATSEGLDKLIKIGGRGKL